MKNLRLLLLMLAVPCSLFLVPSQHAWAGGVGTTGANFLKIHPSARGVALGGAFGAVADDAFGPYWNPAGIAEHGHALVGFSHVEWLEGIKYEYVGTVFPLGTRRAIGLPFLIDDFDDGEDPNALGGSSGTWSDQDAGGSSIVTAGYRQEKRGKAYRLTYIVQPMPNGKPGYAGYWIGLEGRSAKSYRYLVFRIRGAYGGEKIMIGLKDRKQGESRVEINSFGGVSNGWRQVVIPLSAFRNVDLAALDNVSFSFSGSGAVYIDDIMFSGKRSAIHGVGISAGYLTSGNIPRTVEITSFPFYQESGTFDVGSAVVALSYGRGFLFGPVFMPLGVSLKYIGQSLAESNVSGYALDVGMLLAPGDSRRFQFGFTLQNLGSMGAFIQESDPLPLNVKTSFLLRSDSGRTAFSADLDLPVDEEPRFRLGLEWWLFKFMGFRVGYAFGEKGEGLRGGGAGLGVRLAGVIVDYAYSPWGDLGDSHRFSATIEWGRSK